MAVSFAASLKTYAEFDDIMRVVKAVTGAVGRQFEMLTEKAKFPGRHHVGDIFVPFKFGWDYLWGRWADMKRDGITVKVPIEAYTEQEVYYGSNFGMQGIGY